MRGLFCHKCKADLTNSRGNHKCKPKCNFQSYGNQGKPCNAHCKRNFHASFLSYADFLDDIKQFEGSQFSQSVLSTRNQRLISSFMQSKVQLSITLYYPTLYHIENSLKYQYR